jgi:hypothetical protein
MMAERGGLVQGVLPLEGTLVYGRRPGTVVPRLVQFSGVVKDASGKALSGTTGLTISLYAEQEGGAPLWSEAQNVTLSWVL